jgi:hypothetical protein
MTEIALKLAPRYWVVSSYYVNNLLRSTPPGVLSQVNLQFISHEIKGYFNQLLNGTYRILP